MNTDGKISSTPENAPLPGLYEHYKGQRYQVFGIARHSETEEWMVVYQALYAERGFWLRPLTLWLEPVATSNPTDSPTCRFSLLSSTDVSLSTLTEHS